MFLTGALVLLLLLVWEPYGPLHQQVHNPLCVLAASMDKERGSGWRAVFRIPAQILFTSRAAWAVYLTCASVSPWAGQG